MSEGGDEEARWDAMLPHEVYRVAEGELYVLEFECDVSGKRRSCTERKVSHPRPCSIRLRLLRTA